MTVLAIALAALPMVLAVYAYSVYPWLLARLVRGRPAVVHRWPGELPRLSICLPAHNEEAQVAGALDALLAQDYSPERRQIVVVSDASTDATDRIVAGYAARGVELLRLPSRGGKAAAEAAAVPRLRGEIVVNTDASVRLHPGALRALVDALADPRVGVASGHDVSVAPGGAAPTDGEAGYVGYELRVRALESRLAGIVGASGSLYAARAALHAVPVPHHLSRDFAAALVARAHGFRAVSVDGAVCTVPRTDSLRREYGRRVRTHSRGMDTLLHYRRLMDPRAHGGFAWQLASHKACRWAVGPAALLGGVAPALLTGGAAWSFVPLSAFALLLAAGAAGWAWPAGRAMPRWLAAPAFYVVGHAAALHAMARLLRGVDDHVWEPTRRAPAAAPAEASAGGARSPVSSAG